MSLLDKICHLEFTDLLIISKNIVQSFQKTALFLHFICAPKRRQSVVEKFPANDVMIYVKMTLFAYKNGIFCHSKCPYLLK